MKMKSRILFKMQNIKANFLMIYHQEALRHWLVLSHCCLHQKSALYSAHQKLELILHHHRHPQKSLESLLLFVPLQAIKKQKYHQFLETYRVITSVSGFNLYWSCSSSTWFPPLRFISLRSPSCP